LKSNNSEAEKLESIISEANNRIQRINSIIKMTNETEKKISHTKKTMRENRRAYTGVFPLSAFYDVCKILQYNPDGVFPANFREIDNENEEVETKNISAQTEVHKLIAKEKKLISRSQKKLMCAGAKPGTIDYEVYDVLKKYFGLDIDITIDEAVGVALAKIYRNTANLSELEKIATNGKLAVKETGNCAVDVVFDPKLRDRMLKKYRQLREWGRHKVMMEYARIAEEGDDYSTVRAYSLSANCLKDLPEHVLYGLVICLEGHVVRILKVEKDGIVAFEGNCNGKLRFGRTIPFNELTWGSYGLIVYSRQPCCGYGLKEFQPYEYDNPDAVGYDSIRDIKNDLEACNCFKINSESSLGYLKPDIRDSLVTLKFTGGKLYDTSIYEKVTEKIPKLFPKITKSKVIEAFLQVACQNPTGLVVCGFYTTRDQKIKSTTAFKRKIPEAIAETMFMFFEEQDGPQVTLRQLEELINNQLRGHDQSLKVLNLKVNEFMGLDEDIKRKMVILTPRRDDAGNQEDSEAYWVPTLMRSSGTCLGMFVEDESKKLVAFKDLTQNPLHALIVLEVAGYMTGVGNRLAGEERQTFEKYPLKIPEKRLHSLIIRQLDIRSHRAT
jgi:hypothetical protein